MANKERKNDNQKLKIPFSTKIFAVETSDPSWIIALIIALRGI